MCKVFGLVLMVGFFFLYYDDLGVHAVGSFANKKDCQAALLDVTENYRANNFTGANGCFVGNVN